MKLSRRNLLKAGGALGALSVFGVGYRPILSGVAKGWWAGIQPNDPITGNALPPEYSVDRRTGAVLPNPRQYLANTICTGCTSLCGVRVRVDRDTGKVLRVSGNPYHVLSADPFLPYKTPIARSYQALSAYGEQGLTYRATTCGRGNAVLDKLYDPYRVLTPLKRVGPRGGGRWQPITFAQLVSEVADGGNLFGDGHVDGLSAIRDLETPLDPHAPELGPKVNQLMFLAGYKEGRLELAQRFAMFSFGTINFGGRRGNCGLTMRAGYAALLGDWKDYPHLKPDFQHCEFILNIGTAPANAGNPFKRQGKLIAERRSDGKLTYVVVDPVLTNADSLAAQDRSRWIPIIPGTDGALVMGMIRWILEHARYNAHFLSQPNGEVAAAAGEPSWSNATHLVVVEPRSPHYGKFIRGSQLGLAPADEDDPFVVADQAGKLIVHTAARGPAQLFYQGTATVEGTPLAVKTSLQLLLEESQRFTLAEYSAQCGIGVEQIRALAEEFTGHGRKAAADCHGGTMHSNGFYTAYATVMLNALIGNLNWKGGTGAGGGRFADVKPGPRYNLVEFNGKVKPGGVRINRQGFAYEKTTEFKQRKEAGQNPYPAQAPWYPFSASLQTEDIPSALNGYPYAPKALILWNTNPLYAQAGLYEQVKEALADPRRIPLIISIDPFINESSAYADYIVPDTVLYEAWGSTTPWGGHLTKTSSVRWPVVEPPLAKTPAGDPICMESFLIELAKRLNLPGFGANAIADADGTLYPLDHPEDWHLRAVANIAFDAQSVPDADDQELTLTNVDRIRDKLVAVLTPQEWRKAAYVFARGGRFEDGEKAYEGEWLARRYAAPMQIYNETLGTNRNSMTGERFSGVPIWIPPVTSDGTPLEQLYPRDAWPFQAVSTKSQLMAAGVIGTPRLQAIHPGNQIVLHEDDAAPLGIRSGDRIRVASPSASIEGVAAVRQGIQRGVVGIEHGFGHWGLGARPEQIEHKLWHASELRAAGVALNRLGLRDPARPGISTLGDVVVGANARQDIPVRVEKL